MKKMLFMLVLFVHVGFSQKQPPDKFYETYGEDGIDIAYSVKEIYNRQYIVVGSTSSYNAMGTDVLLMLVDSMGNPLWRKNFGSAGNQVGKNLAVNPADSGFILTGFTNTFAHNGYDLYLIRTDKKGNLLWQTSFGEHDWDFGQDVCIASDGNVLLGGSSTNPPGGWGKTDMVVIKADMNNGELIWRKYIGGREDDELQRIIPTSDGLYTVMGNTKSYGDLAGDIMLSKLNLNGDSLNTWFYGALNRVEKCYDMAEDKNTDLVMCGSVDTSVPNSGKNVSYIIKTSINGNKLNEIEIPNGNNNEERAYSIAVSVHGHRYYISRRFYNGPYAIDIQPVVLDYNLVLYNATTYGTYGLDVGYKICATSDSGFVVVGYTSGFGLTNEDICLVKVKERDIVIAHPYLNSIKEYSTYKKNIYYYANKIHLKLNEFIGERYEVFNIEGLVVQSGICRHNEIVVSTSISQGVYLLRIYGKIPAQLKFIKD